MGMHRWLAPLDDLGRDLHLGLRLLRRSPVFAAAAIVSLGLGIGANTAIATLVDAVLLRPLPVPAAGQIYVAEVARPQGPTPRFSYPLFTAARERLAGRAELCAITSLARFQLKVPGSGGDPADESGAGESGRGELASGSCFEVLRQRPQIGRLLTPADDRALGAHPVAVISDSYWRRRFGRSPAALGRELLVDGTSFSIVGVAPAGFMGPMVGVSGPDVWIPTMMQDAVHYAGNASFHNGDATAPWPPQPEVSWLYLIARVPRPADLPAVTGVLQAALASEITHQSGYTGDEEDQHRLRTWRVTLTSAERGISGLREDSSKTLFILLGMVGLLLAIACANVANLLLARAQARRREIAVRLAIGAGRGRLARQLLAEGVLLSLLGGALGLATAGWAARALLVLMTGATRTPELDVGVGLRVFAFTLAVSLATGIAFGLLPALRGSRLGPVEAMAAHTRAVGGAGGTGRRAGLAGRFLVAGQMALSLVLLALASLLGRTLGRLAQVDTGFRGSESVVVASLDPTAGGYAPRELPALYEAVLRRLRGLPGVASATLSLDVPLGGSVRTSNFTVEGHDLAPGEQPLVHEELVREDYFPTLGLAIVRGRPIERDDVTAGRRVTVINQTMARRFFADRDPLGRHWSYGGDDSEQYEIVGVARDARYEGLRGEVPFMAYRPAGQTPGEVLGGLSVRVAGDPASAIRDLRRALSEVAPRLPVVRTATLEQNVKSTLVPERTVSVLTAAFSGLALLLACFGLYGTLAYAVARRTAEIGVRMALGAGRLAVVWLVLRGAFGLVLAGLLLGTPLALLAATGLGKLLYGVGPADLPSHLAAAVVLVGIATVAAYLPARRAAELDPSVALRAD